MPRGFHCHSAICSQRCPNIWSHELLNSDDTCSQRAKVATLPSWRAHLSSVVCAGRANTAPIVVSQVPMLMKTKRQMPESDQIRRWMRNLSYGGGGVIGGKNRCEYLEVTNYYLCNDDIK